MTGQGVAILVLSILLAGAVVTALLFRVKVIELDARLCAVRKRLKPPLDLTGFDAALKNFYPATAIQALAERPHPMARVITGPMGPPTWPTPGPKREGLGLVDVVGPVDADLVRDSLADRPHPMARGLVDVVGPVDADLVRDYQVALERAKAAGWHVSAHLQREKEHQWCKAPGAGLLVPCRQCLVKLVAACEHDQTELLEQATAYANHGGWKLETIAKAIEELDEYKALGYGGVL